MYGRTGVLLVYGVDFVYCSGFGEVLNGEYCVMDDILQWDLF